MSREIICLEFYEVDADGNRVRTDEDYVMYASDVSAVPRRGDRLYLKRTERVLGVDPDKEHRHWEVVQVEWWYEEETDSMRKYGKMRQIAIFCKRVPETENFYR